MENMTTNKRLLEDATKWYLGDIDDDALKLSISMWLRKKGKLPRHIKFLKPTAYNDVGDIVPIVEETKDNIYYYDNFRRWCYIEKLTENIDFVYETE